jgi:hypothetical protein
VIGGEERLLSAHLHSRQLKNVIIIRTRDISPLLKKSTKPILVLAVSKSRLGSFKNFYHP